MHHTPYNSSTFNTTVLKRYKEILEGLAQCEQLFPTRFIAQYYAAPLTGRKDPNCGTIIRAADEGAALAAQTFQRYLSETQRAIREQPGFRELAPHFQQTPLAASVSRIAAMRSRILSSQNADPHMVLLGETSRASSAELGRDSVFSPELPSSALRVPTLPPLAEEGEATFSRGAAAARSASTFSGAGQLSPSAVDDLAAALNALAAAHTISAEDAVRMATVPIPCTFDAIRATPDCAFTILQFFKAHHDASLGLGNRSAAGVYAQRLLEDLAIKLDMSSGNYKTFGALAGNYRCVILYAYLDAAYCFVNVCLASREKLGDFRSPDALDALPIYQRTLEYFLKAIDNFSALFSKTVRKQEEYELYKNSWRRFYAEQITVAWFPASLATSHLDLDTDKFINELLKLRGYLDEELKFIATKMPR